MYRFSKWVAIFALSFFTNTVLSQEFNIGLHASPTIAVPILSKESVASHPSLKARKGNINASGGLNINARFGKVCIETGANVTSRTVMFRFDFDDYTFNNLSGSGSTISGVSNISVNGFAWAVPMQVGVLLDHHEAKTTYDLFGLLGASYETYTPGGESFTNASSNNNGSVVNTSVISPGEGISKSWVNVIAGFKINAILRKVGLVEYGLRYHYPITTAGLYHVELAIANGAYGSAFVGDFYPHLSYIDFHFTYYLLNFKGGEGVKHYMYR